MHLGSRSLLSYRAPCPSLMPSATRRKVIVTITALTNTEEVCPSPCVIPATLQDSNSYSAHFAEEEIEAVGFLGSWAGEGRL